MAWSASQIDRLGDRLRNAVTEADLLLLDDYRNSFAEASSEVLAVLRRDFQLEPTARPAKSTRAILAKLDREGTRLSTMQDVAGCRAVVPDRRLQWALARALMDYFPEHRLIDRLARPSHGYRALHLVVKLNGRWVEIQLRTELQHLWAQLCEQMADRLGAGIKYGGGIPQVRQLLDGLSSAVDIIERREEDPSAVDAHNMPLTPQLALSLIALNRQGLWALLESLGPSIDLVLKNE
jgi:ppGpp synthetase/RelA/SpoT-type nucleotidyltranferase